MYIAICIYVYIYVYCMYICVIHTDKYMDQPTTTRETNRQTDGCQTDRQTDNTHVGDHCVHCMHENFQSGVGGVTLVFQSEK